MKKEEKIEISFKLAEKHEKANLYQVLVHNDDFTPMEFVIRVLEKFFFLSRAKSAEIMLEAHTKGISACGIFSRDLAESKISQVVEYARDYQHPLLCSMENA